MTSLSSVGSWDLFISLLNMKICVTQTEMFTMYCVMYWSLMLMLVHVSSQCDARMHEKVRHLGQLAMALATASHKASASPFQASNDVSASSPVSWLTLASLLARLA